MRQGAPAGPREGLSPPSESHDCTAVSVLTGLRTTGISAWRSHDGQAVTRAPEPRSAQTAGEGPAALCPRADAAALQRFRILPAFANVSDADLARRPLALHDAQSAIAREYGFDSWKALHERVDELTLEFAAALDQFIEAATDGRRDRAERLLALYPAIARANFHTALLLGDAADSRRGLPSGPNWQQSPAGRAGGSRCTTSATHRRRAVRSAGGRAGRDRAPADLARRRPEPAVSLAASCRAPAGPLGRRVFVRSLRLAAALLDAGADPSDGVTLPLAAGAGDMAALDLLVAHGADVNRPWATDGASPLYAILHWAKTPVGVRWLLDHGADPDPVFAGNGETPLARGGGELGRLSGRGTGESWRRRRAPACRRPHALRRGRTEWKPRRGGLAAGARRAGRVVRRRSPGRRVQPR